MVLSSKPLAFDPLQQSIQTLLSSCQDDWGKPAENRELLLPFGIRPLDMALYGLDVINGEVVLIQGPEKQRKSTLVANIVAYYMQSAKPKVKPLTVIDSLESGMTPKRYRDTFISIVATQQLLSLGHAHHAFCPVCQTSACKQLGISPEFLRFNSRTPEQSQAIEDAINIMADWPMQIYGASDKEGDTRSLLNSIVGSENVQSRWRYLVEQYGVQVFVTDHLQQYSFFENLSDYEKQIRTVSAVSDVVASDKVVALVISQVSLGSQREASSGTGKYTASGGRKAAAEATSIISVNYESGSGTVCITLEDSRKSASFSVHQPLEDTSGAFYGEAVQGKKQQFRPGMEDAAGAAPVNNSNGSRYSKR